MLGWNQRQTMQIGQNIRKRRKELGINQSQLADGLFSVQTVSLMERGKLKISPETLAVFAKRLACEVDDLLVMHDLKEDWLEEMLQEALQHKEAHQDAKALETLHALYSEAYAKSNTVYLIESSYHLCLLYNKAAKNALSNEWGQQCLGLLQGDKHLEHRLNIYITIGNNYYVLGKMWDSYDLLREAEKLIDHSLQDSLQAGKLFYSMAILKQMLQNWEGCLWYSERALRVFEEYKNTIHTGRTLMMMGTASKNQERYDKAHHYLDRSIRILSQTSDTASLGRCYHNLGELELKTGHPENARRSFARSLRIKRQANDRGSITNTLRALAKIAMQYGNYEEARRFLEECLQLADELQSPLQQAMAQRSLGDLALLREREEEFVSHYRDSIATFERLGFSTELSESAEKLGDYFLEKGDVHQASAYLQTAARHYRRLLNKS